MVDNLAAAILTATGATQGRSLGDRFADALAITDFKNADTTPVVGDWNGTTGTDNYTGIQAAIDETMPNTASSGGNTRPLFIPPGNYMISHPLNIQGAKGIKVHGAGQRTSTITYAGSGTQGNTLGIHSSGFDEVTPVFMCEALREPRFMDFSITGTTANRTSSGSLTYGFYFISSDFVLDAAGDINTQAHFSNMSVENFAVHGFMCGNNANAENYTWISCSVDQCDDSGIMAGNYNSLNHVVVGGSFTNCGSKGTYTGPGSSDGMCGALNALTGTFLSITGVRFENNYIDYIQRGSNGNLIGCLHKGGPLMVVAITSMDGATFVSGCHYQGQTTQRFLDCGSSHLHATSCVYDPHIYSTGLPGNSGAGYITNMNGGGMTLENLVVHPAARSGGTLNVQLQVGGSVSPVVLRNCDFDGTPIPSVAGSNPLAQIICRPVTVAELPTASAVWKGLRLVVSNHTGAVAFGGTPTGGGTTAVPVFCDGSAWKIGG